MAKKQRVDRQVGRQEGDCAHCLLAGTMKPNGTTKKDTTGTKVRVLKCSECGYTEGRPTEG